MLAFAAGLLHTLTRLWRSLRGGPGLSDELLLLLAALAPLLAAQVGFAARGPGVGPWLAAFPLLAVLGARAILSAALAAWPARAGALALLVSTAVLAPGIAASVRAFPELGASWGELAGGTPGAATLGLPRHDGEAAAALLGELSDHARPGARVHWIGVPPAALAVYAATAGSGPTSPPRPRPRRPTWRVVALDRRIARRRVPRLGGAPHLDPGRRRLPRRGAAGLDLRAPGRLAVDRLPPWGLRRLEAQRFAAVPSVLHPLSSAARVVDRSRLDLSDRDASFAWLRMPA